MISVDQISRYKTLLETARCFGKTMDLCTLIDQILDRSREVMRAEASTLLLPEAHSDDLIIHSTDPRVASLRQPLKVPAGRGLAGEVFRTRQILNVKDAQEDPRHYRAIGDQVGFITHAILTIPLLDGTNCLGVLQSMNPRDRQFFDHLDEEIFEGFGAMIVNALSRLDAQQREIERAQAQQELALAREIQDSFLPPSVQRFSFCHAYLNSFPAQIVGGDFYFLHPLGNNRLLVGLGDVTGKGIPAALTMARATAMIQVLVEQFDYDLGEWVTLLNRQLVQDLKAGRFIGMTFLLLDATASRLQVCSAGQFAPFHFDGRRWNQFKAHGHLPLGITSAVKYTATEAPLERGDFWLLFSDGITEGRNAAGEELTVQGFLHNLTTKATGAGTMQAAVQSWQAFADSAVQHDDASLMLLDWRGLRPAEELTTSCCLETLAQIRGFVEAWGKFAGFDDITTGQLVLACNEAVTNIFRHGYDQTPGPLKFRAEVSNGNISFQIYDKAKAIDQGSIKGRSLCELRPGGLGTFIIGQVFDQVKYEPLEVGTVLTLRKRLP